GSLDAHAGSADAFARVVGWTGSEAGELYPRIRRTLAGTPVEDLRIDFEDGYGVRPDAEEDAAAAAAGSAVSEGMKRGTLPAGIGIRIKQFSREFRRRSERTLKLFLSALFEGTKGQVPRNFVVTLPKAVTPSQVAALASVLRQAEKRHRLEAGALK